MVGRGQDDERPDPSATDADGRDRLWSDVEWHLSLVRARDLLPMSKWWRRPRTRWAERGSPELPPLAWELEGRPGNKRGPWHDIADGLDLVYRRAWALHNDASFLDEESLVARPYLHENVYSLIVEMTREPLEDTLVWSLLSDLRQRYPVLTRSWEHLEEMLRGTAWTESHAAVGNVDSGVLPVVVWLDSDRDKKAVQDALKSLVEVSGLEITFSGPEQVGSWFRRFGAGVRRGLSSAEAQIRFEKAERALELQVVGKRQAEVDSVQAEAVAKLLVALENTASALVQIGSILLIKVDGVPAVRNLTPRELRLLERNPSLLKDPAAILSALQNADEISIPPDSQTGERRALGK